MSDNNGDHSIVRYANGGSGWAEFECGSCSVDMDMMDFEQIEIVEIVRKGGEFKCPSCGVSRPVQDLTEDGLADVACGPTSQREKVAIAIWHRHAPDHHVDWGEESDQEIYLCMADAAIETIHNEEANSE